MEVIYFQILLNGIVAGLIYALIAAGLSLIFGVQGIVNFAHGELVMLGAYAMVFFLPLFGLQYLPAAVLAAIFAGVLGGFFYVVCLSSRAGRDFESAILTTLGLSILVVAGTQYLLSSSPRVVNTQFGFSALQWAGMRLPWVKVAAVGVALGALLLVWLVLRRTQLGRAMRAVAQNREAAAVVGIDARRIGQVAFVMGAALAGVAGAALAPLYTVQPTMGQVMLLKAFALVVIGGLGSIPGAVLAGLALGILENFVGSFTNVVLQEACAFVLMIAMLALKPAGLFGRTMRAG